MHIEINLKNQNKLYYLVELLKSLDFVESVKIQPDAPTVSAANPAYSLFEQFYGSTKSGLTINEIDERLDKLRNEWDRTI